MHLAIAVAVHLGERPRVDNAGLLVEELDGVPSTPNQRILDTRAWRASPVAIISGPCDRAPLEMPGQTRPGVSTGMTRHVILTARLDCAHTARGGDPTPPASLVVRRRTGHRRPLRREIRGTNPGGWERDRDESLDY